MSQVVETFSREEAHRLMERTGDACVSVYMTTNHAGVASGAEHIRLRDLLDEGERRAAALGLRAARLREVLAPARALLTDESFWRRHGEGLAVFAADGFLLAARLAIPVRDGAHVGRRFHVKPLLPLLTGDGRYHVLLLHKENVRLYEGSRDSLREVDLNGVPEELARLLRDSVEFGRPDEQSHVTGRGYGGAPRTMVGVGGGSSTGAVVDAKTRTREYYQIMDKALRAHLRNDRAPLVLAGLANAISLYREVCTDNHVTREGVVHGFERFDIRELHRMTWNAVAPTFLETQRRWAARLRELNGSGKASTDVVEVADAARAGRVEALFVSLDEEVWGEIEAETDAPVIHRERRDEDEDLVDLAAVRTSLQKGEVFAMRTEELEGMEIRSPVAAVFRY